MTSRQRIRTILSFIMRHPANKKAAPVLFISILMVIVAFSICWMPQWMSYSSLQAKFRQKNEQIIRTKTAIAIGEVFKNVSDQVSAIEIKLSCRKSDGELSAGINKLAVSGGLKLSIENSGNQKESISGYDIIVQEIIVEGSYQGLRSFLAGLENFNTVTAIRKIKIENNEKKPGMIKANILLAMYKRIAGKATSL